MKRFFTFIIILVFAVPYMANTQNQRTLLVERFTNAGCGPCAYYGPAFTALLEANADKLASIEYHWYYPGNDPMHNHNPEDPNGRMNYYNQNGVPFCALSGNYFQGNIANLTQAKIDESYVIPTPVEMRMHHYFSPNQDSIYVTLLIRSDEAISGALKGHIVIIEKEIHFAAPAGSNGEKDFYNVVKKMLPTRSGTTLSDFESGDYAVIQGSWKLANVYDFDQLSAVGFLQDNSEHVHQAIYSSTNPIVPFYETDASMTKIQNIPSFNCNGLISPVVTLENYGAETLTSATIEVSVNGSVIHSEEWTGSLLPFKTKNLTLENLEFDLEEKNTVTITVSNPNGNQDEYAKNNSISYDFDRSKNANGTEIQVVLRTNNAPEEISWKIRDDNGQIVAESEPYTQPNTTILTPVELPGLGCYEFTIYAENGLTNNGNGVYIVTSNNVELFRGNNFVGSERNFIAYGFVGLDEISATNEAKIYPNPTTGTVSIDLSLTKNTDVEIVTSDISGRVVSSKIFNNLKVGSHTLINWAENLNKGIYIVTIKTNAQVITQKLVVE
ncbi:MAG: T9SS type A sorting domain-containing protein [Lentimicrobiaceae bacterium]|jgi:hypothetical protein|nr:T9SS type A sorting domain-containing protein [Lentimicrobiaceae bacterium]